MVSLRKWFLTLAALCVPGAVFAEPPPKKVALLVGINKYLKRSFPDLNYAERDVDELARELEKLGFHCRVLTGSERGERRATRENIEEQLKQLLRGISKEDIV